MIPSFLLMMAMADILAKTADPVSDTQRKDFLVVEAEYLRTAIRLKDLEKAMTDKFDALKAVCPTINSTTLECPSSLPPGTVVGVGSATPGTPKQ